VPALHYTQAVLYTSPLVYALALISWIFLHLSERSRKLNRPYSREDKGRCLEPSGFWISKIHNGCIQLTILASGIRRAQTYVECDCGYERSGQSTYV
jgi:hypothetical protein